jgi:predicted permease
MMGSWLGDVSVSVRQLAKAPGFTAAAVVVLALGIGLNAAMFTLVYAFGLMGRPYADPDRVVQLYSSQTAQPDAYRAFSYPAYRAIVDGSSPFAGVLAHSPTIVGLSEGGTSRRTFAVLASRNYFEVLGVPIVSGRGFTADEDRPGQDIPVAIATWSYWQRNGFDPNLVGSTIRVNERPFTIVGITPRGFTGTMMVLAPELFLPLGVFHTLSTLQENEQTRTLDRADAYNLFLVGRLGNGVTMAAASDRLATAGQGLAREFPGAYQDARLTLSPLPRFGTSTSPSDESVLGLLGAVMLALTGAVLLTVCLNLASMLMARGRARCKEFAIRMALGSGRARIVRQLLTEGLILSLAGGVGGVALGLLAIDRLIRAFAGALPIAIVLEGAVSPALVAATLICCLLATLWFALGPALRHSRADLVADLKPNAGEDPPDRRRRMLVRNPLLVGQIALSLALLIAAGLFVRMAQVATAVDFGFRADRTVLAEVDGDLAGYATPQLLDLYASVERRLTALPGVESAAVGALVPLGMVNIDRSIRRAGINVPDGAEPPTPEEGRAFGAPWNAVSGSYFAAMGVRLVEGRTFTDAESFVASDRAVAIIDEALAARLWPDGGALGQRIEFVERNRPVGEPPRSFDVVGIVGSTHRQLFERDLPGAVYVPFAQGARGNAWFHVRPWATDRGLVDRVRSEIRAAAPGLPLFSARPYVAHIESSVEFWALKLTAALFGAFGGLALIVALVGIYGVMSYSVARRTREIGIRMAVGATVGAVRRLILGEGLSTTLAGVAIGWVLGLGIGRLLASIFVDLAAFDAFIFTAAPAVLVAAALGAAWWPARRATAIDPMTALRGD